MTNRSVSTAQAALSTILANVALAVNAPLVGLRDQGGAVFHAVTLDMLVAALNGDASEMTAPCGATPVGLLPWPEDNGRNSALLWPPPSKAGKLRRCRDCWLATGKQRPRTHFQPKAAV